MTMRQRRHVRTIPCNSDTPKIEFEVIKQSYKTVVRVTVID